MVKEYGMSTTIGQVYFFREKRPLFVEAGMPAGGEYSEATAEMIDKEIKEIISVQYKRAVDILREKKDVMDKGAEVLLEKEKIDGEELKVLAGLPVAPSPNMGEKTQPRS
jgi:cell division protease FtsH